MGVLNLRVVHPCAHDSVALHVALFFDMSESEIWLLLKSVSIEDPKPHMVGYSFVLVRDAISAFQMELFGS